MSTAIVLRREPWAVEDPVLDTAIFILDVAQMRAEADAYDSDCVPVLDPEIETAQSL